MILLIIFQFLVILTIIIAINGQFSANCGRRLATIDWPMTRIIGGTDAKPGDYPWQASILIDIPAMNKSMHVCGGTLISDQWILTAAHCMDSGLKMDYYFVVIGVIDLGLVDSSKYKKYYINKTIIHSEWNLNKTMNDIALVKLSERINFTNKSIEPICLIKNDTNFVKEGTKCFVTGWGAIWAKFNETYFEVGPMSRILKQVMLPMFDIHKCAYVHNSKPNDPQINLVTEVCAGGSLGGGSGVCVSDSGGPLQCQLSDNKWYQIGIVSWTYRCASPGVPDVFTRVSRFSDWIENIVENN